MCYGFQLMAQGLGGEVAHTGAREYGRTPVTVTEPGTLLADLPAAAHRLDVPRRLGRRGARRASTCSRRPTATPVAAFEDVEPRPGRRAVAPRGAAHRARPEGARALPASTSPAAGRPGRWSTSSRSRSSGSATQIGDRGRAICGLSGGVDSAVAAAIVQRAIGDRLTCVYVDHGLMRKGETEQVERDFVAATGVDLHVVDAEKQFLDALAGVSDPEEKRKIIGREFIRVFEAAEARDPRRRRPRSGEKVAVPRPGHALPRRRRVRRRRRHLQHQVPPQRRRPARRPRVRAGRAAAHAVQGRGPRWSASSSACPPRSSGASRSPAPASASGSSARSPASGSTSCARPTRSPARS